MICSSGPLKFGRGDIAIKVCKGNCVGSHSLSIKGWGALCAALVIGVVAGFLTTPVLAEHGDKPIQINAGSPGWDHSFPYIAEKMGFWKKYGLKVKFLQESFSRNRQMMSIADFDAGYAQISDIMRYIEKGRRTVDAAKRKEIYREAIKLLHRDVHFIFLGHLPVAQAWRSHVKGLKTNTRGDIAFQGGGIAYVWIEK